MGPPPALRVGTMPAVDQGRVLRALRQALRTYDDLDITTTVTWGSRADVAAVRNGRLDALVLVGPVDLGGLHTEVIGSRDRCAVLAEDHPLARQVTIRLEHLVDLPTFRRPDDVPPAWRSYWLNLEARGREPRYIGRSATELEALVAIGTGRVAGVAPQGWGRLPGLVTRPVVDLSPAPLVLVTRPGDLSGPVASFVEALRRREATALTPAERRVAALVVDGLTDAEIAQALSLSSRTVESHIASARRRLGLRSRSHLAAVAVQRALV